MQQRRIGVFGWGVVAPGARDIEAFRVSLAHAESRLSTFHGFGPSNFLVGEPEFDFADYKPWIDARFPPNRFPLLERKFGGPSKYAIGAFVQALAQNAGIEGELRELGARAQVIVGGGLTDLPSYDRIGRELDRAQRRWDRFWARPERNDALARHLAGDHDASAPTDPSTVADELDRDDAESAWWTYWSARSSGLASYLEALRAIEGVDVGADVNTSKGTVIKAKQRGIRDLRSKWGAPEAPWDLATAPALWNIASTPSSQISMLGHITGMCFSPFAACSTFGFALKLGIEAIRRDEAKLVVVGATDPAPHPISVAAFYDARVLSHDGTVSQPLTGMRGTHVAGGATVWIIGDLDHYVARGWTPLGLEPLAVGITADADHIITPSKEGAVAAIHQALDAAEVTADQVGHFDMHATGTPGDLNEIEVLRAVLPASCRFSARKGEFGHGMGAGGGWELTAQYLGHAAGAYFPTTVTAGAMHPAIRAVHDRFVLSESCASEGAVVGKLSMGVGGVNACVISRSLG
ncbi:MAG: beta-ketoacyl synthase [Deltaproteobacteria bacterium]|nr:beta-ketoacyl synthase [Nannocystaceae bacterium]